MSIEQALAENTSAIRELIAAIRAGVPTTAAQVVAVATEAKATKEQVKAEKKADTPAPAPAPAEKKEEPAAQVSDAAEYGKTAAQATEALHGHANKPEQAATYEDCKTIVLKLSKDKGRDVAVQVLSRFGVQKLPDLLPESYDDLVKLGNEVLEGAKP